jgi:NADP-dependent 3-hydroxy acid dehydrogenase YdfG
MGELKMRHGRGREVAVVTGASGGIGRAAARAFAQQGARVALLARGKKGLAGAKREVEACGMPRDTAVAKSSSPGRP